MLHYLFNVALFYDLHFHIALVFIAKVIVALFNIVLWQYCTIRCNIVLMLRYLMLHWFNISLFDIAFFIVHYSMLYYLNILCEKQKFYQN